MSRLVSAFLEALGQALAEKGRKALTGQMPFGDALPDVARLTLTYAHQHLVTDDIRLALGEMASLAEADYQSHIDKMMEGLMRVQSVPFQQPLREYLSYMPVMIRSVFRRPSDPTGRTPPEKLDFYKPEQLLLFLPPRLPRFKPGDTPSGLDNWKLVELRGLGECSEVWIGEDPSQPPGHSPAALKFAIDEETKERISANQELFLKVFDLNDIHGVVPLRSVYLDTDPPCLESAFVYGYDLTGLMHEWKWRFDVPKPDAALKLMKRVTEVLAKAHKKRIVHRDLKPSNILIHPTEGGRFTLWITDFGWGQIEAIRSIELARGGTPRAEQMRLAYFGAYTPLYASPQQQKREPSDPRDDVHALGVIWYQLLKRDPHLASPVGKEWAEELYPHGFTESQARLLTSCLATRPERRPLDASSLLDLLNEELTTLPSAGKAPDDGSKILGVKGQSSMTMAAIEAKTQTPLATSITSRGKQIDNDAAARAAASLLGVSGGPGRMGSAPASTGTNHKLIRNVVGMTFAQIPAGTFQMGSPEDEPGRRGDEGPRHLTRLTHSFYMSIYPVTQSQYERVMGRNPSFFHQPRNVPGHGVGDLPVESVSWYDAERFCHKLAHYGDEESMGRRYRLPTEAEWEYACRAGTESPFSCGDSLSAKEAHFTDPGPHNQGKPIPVGQFPPNPFGLFDMHGNVLEWVSDWYDEYYYFDSPGNDPIGPTAGDTKVIRGGSWACPPLGCRSAARKAQNPDKPCNTIGFRVVFVMDGK